MKKIVSIFLSIISCLFLFSGCKEEKIFTASEDFSNPTSLEINLQPDKDELVFDDNIIISHNNKYFEMYFNSAYKYSISFAGHPFTYKIYSRGNTSAYNTTHIVESSAGRIFAFPSASNSYLLEIEGYNDPAKPMAMLIVNMTIERYLK